MAGFIPLILIFGLIYFLLIRPARKAQARPSLAMIKSPWRTDEYRDAIVSVLSPGEVLVSFADCVSIETSWGGLYKEIPKVRCHWGFLALTNINIREGAWNGGEYVGGSWVPTPEIRSMTTYGIDDVVSASHSKGVGHATEQAINQWFTRALWEQLSRAQRRWTNGFGSLYLGLALTSGDGIGVASPFVEFEALVTSIDAAKSGALVVKNTTAAADALDQLVPLLNDGILTQEEFDRAKDGFLGAAVEVRESSVGLLRQLHSLHKSGVLTESEFNLKKWDILSKDE